MILRARAALLLGLAVVPAPAPAPLGPQPAPAVIDAAAPQAQRLVTDVVFTRTGGFAGVQDWLEITPGGEARRTSRTGRSTTRMLPADETAGLARLLHDSALFDRDRTFRAQGADLITYGLHYDGITIEADETSVPDRLQPVLERLLHILNED